MRIFHCDHCYNPVFFENVQCVRCSHALAYLPDLSDLCAVEPASEGLWKVLAPDAKGVQYRLCQNYTEHNVCNWAVRADENQPLCASCRLTRVIPDLGTPGLQQAWYALELAKRRVVYTLMNLGLPVVPKSEECPEGLAFEFRADVDEKNRVLTGHADGVITINVAEADDAEREKRRVTMHEPYRTLLGHFRHEVGHYYWDRLIQGGQHLAEFRELFGDERQDYQKSLERHYQEGPAANWQETLVSAYAGAHPWEDWAETWAHYLHITDTLETASDCGLALRPRNAEMPATRPRFSLSAVARTPIESVVSDWLAISFLLNNLSRGLGEGDLYPFILSETVIAKLGFVHRVCAARTAV